MVISSSANPRIKAIRALRQRKERERTGLCFVEGIRLVTEAIQSGAPVETLLLAPDLLTSQPMHELARTQAKHGVPLIEVTREVFARVASRDNPQGIAAVVRQRWNSLDRVAFGAALCWIALDAAQDPGNIGTILRTSDAVGGAGIILLGNSADPYDPSAVRASMGAVFTQQLARAGWNDFLAWKRLQGATLLGTSDSATQGYSQASYRAPLVLLMGSEQKGLSREQQAACDLVVRIPMLGRSDSLNLAVATGVILYEIFNQKRTES